MKTLLSYQKFTEQTNKGFVNVPTSEAKKVWRDKLLNYRYLHAIGVTVTKANRKYIFSTLEKLKTAQSELITAIDNDETNDVKNDLKTVIIELQKLLLELSIITDKVDEVVEETTKFVPTMIYFDKTIIDKDGNTIYVTKGGKKFTVKNKQTENNLSTLIEKCNLDIIERIGNTPKVKKESNNSKISNVIESDESVTKVQTVKTTKVKKDKVIDVDAEQKRLEKRDVMRIGIETNNDKFVERVYEKKRLF